MQQAADLRRDSSQIRQNLRGMIMRRRAELRVGTLSEGASLTLLCAYSVIVR